MKKFICLSIACFMFCALSFAQEAKVVESKKECVPTEACAKKMGMTLDECRALCKKQCKSAVASTDMNQITRLASTETETSTKSCCTSIEACAKKMGMSVEECKRLCKDKIASEKQVASAVMENGEKPKANCCKKAAAGCKKKG